MNDSAWQWPALQGKDPVPERLKAGRAVWGKVHGAASDFRWIAAGPGVSVQACRLEKELSLGFEDAPRAATCWRALRGVYCALSCYPSRAMDAAYRSGFLEKQLLEWVPEGTLPAALGALLFLPRVATFDDTVWWKEREDFRWSEADFFLSLEEEPPAGIDGLDTAIEHGRAALGERVDEKSLARLYAALLARRSPAFLTGLEEPLPTEALAALFLPLPRWIADRISIAGWPQSGHVDPEAFSRLWNVLVCDRVPAAFGSLPETEIPREAWNLARMLLAGDPRQLGSAPVPSPATVRRQGPAPAASPEILERLRAFAQDERQRWFEPEELTGPGNTPLRLLEDQAGLLADLVRGVEDEISRLSGPLEKLQHLEVKADLLRAAVLVLAPSCAGRIGLPKSGRVPALLFGPDLDGRDGEEMIRRLGEEIFRKAVEQSLSCKPDRYGVKVESWLEQRGMKVKEPSSKKMSF